MSGQKCDGKLHFFQKTKRVTKNEAAVSHFKIKRKCMKKILVINGHPRREVYRSRLPKAMKRERGKRDTRLKC